MHYNSAHLVGTSGGNANDLQESLNMMEKGLINPAIMITHIGGLDSAVDTIRNLPHIADGKKLIYTNISMKLTAITDLAEMESNCIDFPELADLIQKNNGIWSAKAEEFLLKSAEPINI